MGGRFGEGGGGSGKIVASLRLKNERGERLSSHRSVHVTGGLGRIAQFV